ncbi:MAG TPA: SAM-dependent methyltransferase [Candidatus Thermoplasmatota archaeon]|nr:SAM-dependent methyltransferase [Candidatus Thermoplasmatota archaeon]
MPLADELRARIEKDGPMTVRDFMAAAAQAYYARGPDIGAEGDFYTASNVSLFPLALSRFVKGALARMDGIARVVELGGGRGDLASQLGVDITVVEPSVGLAKKQEARGLQVASSLGELRPRPTIFVANELLDALPVHRIHMTPEGAREGYVVWRDEEFVETTGPLTLGPASVPSDLQEGDVAEVCVEAGALLDAMAVAAPRCIALFLDYAAGPPRPGGTLRGFSKHQVTSPLRAPGEQDITADVDFAAIERLALARGFEVLGARSQGEFLADLGLVEDMMSAMGRGDHDAYAAGKSLLMPTAMGERFRVLCLGRGVAKEPPLPGFRADLYPGASRR